MDEKQLKALWESMSATHELGNFDAFKKNIYSDSNFRKGFWEEAAPQYEIGDYKTFDESFKKKVTPLQPSPSLAIPSLSQTIEKNRDITNQFQPQGENVNVQRSVFADYENVLGKRASLYKAESNAAQNLQTGGIGSMPSMVSSTYENLENQLKTIPGEKEKYDAEAKKLGDVLIPAIKTGIKNLEGKFTTKNGELDYSAIGKASSMMSQQLGGGDYVKEQIRQQIINQEEYSKVKPAVNQFANQVWKKITGKTVDEFVGEKNQAVKDFILQKQVLEQNFQKTQVTLNKEYTAKSEQINEKYKAILSQAKSEEEQSQIASSYITEMNGLASQYNSRINRVKKEVDDELKSKISKAELSDETKKQLDIVYNEAYKYVTKANLDKKQREQDELYGKNWYNQLLPYNPYTDWEKAKKTFFAPKFIALGWKSATGAMFNGVSNLGNGLVGLGLGGGFTDFLRGQQQRADRLETVDVELKGTNWLKPNTFATRLGKQIGFQAPIIAATAFTKNPFMAGTIGFGVEQVQNAGEVYNTMMQQYDDPIKAQNAAKNYLTKNLPTLPLYFLESEMMLRFAKAKPGVLKNVAAENLNEVTQELFQGYTQQQEYKNAKSLGTFLKEDAPNIALETALTTTLQSGLFAAGGKIMKKLGTDVEYAQKSHLYNLVSTKGLNAAFGVLELKANNNLISPEEMAAQKEKLTKLNNDIFTLKDNGLTDVQVGVYLGLTAKLDAIREKQAKSTNPQITQSYQKEIESIEKKIQDAVMGKLDGVSVTLPSGSTMTLEGNGEDILSELKDEIATGQADITSTDDKVNQKVEQLKQKSPPPVPDEALEQIQNEVGEIEDNFQQKGYSIDFVNDSVVISDLDGNIIGIEDIPADLQQQAVRYEDLAIPKLEEQKPTEVKSEIKEPTEEEKFKDIKNGNVVTFIYEKESDVPAELKGKISSYGENDGKPIVRVTISKSEADYLLGKETNPEKAPIEVKEPTKPLTNEEKVKQLRAEEQADYDAMTNPKDEVKRKEIYNKYDKLITPLLEAEKKEQTPSALRDVESTAKELVKGSKAVNENGEPIVVYHGTNNIQDIIKNGLDPTKRGETTQFGDERPYLYFSNNFGNANFYAKGEYTTSNKEETIKKERINLNKFLYKLNENEKEILFRLSKGLENQEPLSEIQKKIFKYKSLGISDKNANLFLDRYKAALENIKQADEKPSVSINSGIVKSYLDIKNPLIIDNKDGRYNFYSKVMWGDLIDRMENEGFDGLIIKNTKDPFFGDVYIVGDPKQIKTFDYLDKEGNKIKSESLLSKEQTKEQPKQIKIAEDESENKYANDKLTEKDNIEQEPSIKAIESKAESNDKAELNEVVKQVDEKLNAATDVRVVPLSSITTDESRFQNRQELDQQKLNDIAENWKDADQDPIHVWTDPKNGKTYVLSGHHRFYGAKKAGRENVKIVDRTNDFTETQAIKFAKEEANANRTMETPLERAKALREKTKRGDSKQEINKFLEREGKNKSFVQNLAALNPLGKVMQMLGQFGNAEDRQTQKETEQRADWIGEARRTIAGLTDAHENEMFDFLFDKDASKRITTKADFLQKVRSVVKPLEPNVPLNIARFKNKTQGEAAYDEAVNEKKAEIAGKQEKINEINDRFSNPQNPNYISTENKEYASARSIADNKISQLESERKLLQKQLEDIYREKGKYTSAATSGSLFSATSPESTISKPSFDALIERISKAFPKVKFFYDEGTFNKKMKKYGNGNLMRTPSGTIYGATFPDGSVYINQKVLSAETPIHEASHIWEALFPKEWKNGVELFRQSKGFQKALQEVQSNKAYKNKTLQEQESEALNTLIGRKGEGYFQNELLSKFKAWLQKFFNYIGQKFGVKLSPDTKLNQFVNEVIGDILGGKELKGKLTSKDVKFQIIGENAELAQEVRDNLQVAREMEIEKKDAKTIRLATGWERGIDGKWRYEILDVELNSIVNLYDELTNERNDIIYNKAKGKSISELKKENSPIIKRFVELENKFNQLNTNKEIPLGQIVYGEVLKAYPKLKDIKVVLGADIGYGTKGIWVNSENTIYLSNGLNTLKDKSESYSILLHEIQHAIQDIEGFAKGGNEATILEELEPLKEKLIEINKLRDKWQNSKINSKEEKIALNNYNKALDNFDFAKFNRLKKYAPKQIGSVYSFEGYQALAGEAEARNVQKRLSMTAEQRKATPLQETEDIAREEQIILFETSKSLSRNKSIFEDYDKYNALKNSEKVKNPQIVEQLKSKYGQELNKVKDITLNFDKYITQLLNSGYIKDKIC